MELLLETKFLKKKLIKFISALDFYNIKGLTKKLFLFLPYIKIKPDELYSKNCKNFYLAILSKHNFCFNKLYYKCNNINHYKNYIHSSEHDNLYVFKKYYKKGFEINWKRFKTVLQTGSFKMFMFVYNRYENLDIKNTKFCKHSAMNKKLKILKFLRNKGYEWDKKVYFSLINCNRDISYVIQNNCPYDSEVIMSCAYVNRFKQFKILIDNSSHKNIKLSTKICIESCIQGRVKMLQYAYEHGCLVNKEVWNTAKKFWMKYKHNMFFECLEYLYNIGCPGSENLEFLSMKFHGYCIVS